MFQDLLEIPRTYYHFDHKGWRFFVLDDIQPAPDGRYQAYIDEPQWAWLEKELASKDPGMPATVISHIPILTVTLFDDTTLHADAYEIPTAYVCRDARKLAELFARHNVRLALSGHIHQLDRIEFLGVTFICGGAVSGNWWQGPRKGMEEGFGVVDVEPGGKFRYRYHDYGWDAQVDVNEPK